MQGLTGSVTSATLRIYANSASTTGYDVYGVADNTWTETGITYSNAPAMGSQLGSSGTFSAGVWTSVDVTSYITGNGVYNLAFSTTSNTNISFSSREGANAPQLVIQTSSGSTNTPTPTSTATSSPTLTPSRTLTATSGPSATFTPTPSRTLTPTPGPSLTPTFTATVTSSPTPTVPPQGPITINYIYDPLSRLTEANYSNNDYYHYTYDAVGNRKTQARMLGGALSNDTYVYDHANRIQTVNGVTYVFDANGNLENDGVNAYTYDAANQLISMSGTSIATTYRYNGLGDRIQETLNGQTTTFTMDLNAGLTQALSDGTNTYIYGNGRIAQAAGTGTEYFLGDALGSVRQMTNASAQITYARVYDPYGVVTQTGGAAQTAYGYTGEFTSNNMVYLRSRMYSPKSGRFITKDSWLGDYNKPLSLNGWMYVYGNPINKSDPSGRCINDEVSGKCLPHENQLPNIEDYDEKVPPAGIFWVSNKIGNNINSSLAPIYDRNGHRIVNQNAAQFQIAGHEKSSTCLYNKKTKTFDCESSNVNFCGQVVLSAILSQLLPDVTAKSIVEDLNYQSGTGVSDLVSYLNTNYSQYVSAEGLVMSSNVRTGQVFFDYMSDMFAQDTLVTPIVNIISGNSYPPGDPDSINGQLGTSGGIAHWVLITGVSQQWKSQEDSRYNWVRIFNPFDNGSEYYWWPDFKLAWGTASTYYRALGIHIPK